MTKTLIGRLVEDYLNNKDFKIPDELYWSTSGRVCGMDIKPIYRGLSLSKGGCMSGKTEFKMWDFPTLTKGDFEVYKKHITTHYGDMSETEKQRYFLGEWIIDPMELLVLYTKGNRKDKEAVYGKDGVHYINTTRQDIHEVLCMRYKDIVVEEGVSDADRETAMKFLV